VLVEQQRQQLMVMILFFQLLHPQVEGGVVNHFPQMVQAAVLVVAAQENPQ
jgi:hypothetical protein